jgi:hypothetical protein
LVIYSAYLFYSQVAVTLAGGVILNIWGSSVPTEMVTEDLYVYGFHPHESFRIGLSHTNEYGLDGGFIRPVWALRCMRGPCRLDYDGEEHAMFRLTACTMIGREVFEQFDKLMLELRYCVQSAVKTNKCLY